MSYYDVSGKELQRRKRNPPLSSDQHCFILELKAPYMHIELIQCGTHPRTTSWLKLREVVLRLRTNTSLTTFCRPGEKKIKMILMWVG